MSIEVEKSETMRGFRVDTFPDANGVMCSLQESSAAGDEALVWLGCNDIGLKRFEPYKGWADVELEQDAPHGVCHVANTRMHLSQSQVSALLPALIHFAETGELPILSSDEVCSDECDHPFLDDYKTASECIAAKKCVCGKQATRANDSGLSTINRQAADLAETIVTQLSPEVDDSGFAYIPWGESVENTKRLIVSALSSTGAGE